MSWLYLFVGATAAWVFMGIFILLLDVFGKKNPDLMNKKLCAYWDISILNQKKQIEALKAISNSIDYRPE